MNTNWKKIRIKIIKTIKSGKIKKTLKKKAEKIKI